MVRFGCLGYWSITKNPESKLALKAIRGVMIGYLPMGYLFLQPETGKFFKSRNVRFSEKLVYGDRYKKDTIQFWSLPSEIVDPKEFLLNLDKNKDQNKKNV